MRKIKLFSFIVRYLGVLKHVPMVALFFDAGLTLWSLLNGSNLPEHLDSIKAEVRKWPGASVGLHKYGGVQFNYNGRELGHIHGNGLLDMRFSRAIKNELLLSGRVDHHHVFKNSGWVSFYIRTADDAGYACDLLKMAYAKRKKL